MSASPISLLKSSQQPPLTRRFALPFLLVAVLSETARATPEWVVLDPDRPSYKVDLASREHKGPWVEYTQMWGALENGMPAKDATVERGAVNCLTGARGSVQYPHYETPSGPPVRMTMSFSEIEHATPDQARLQTVPKGLIMADSTAAMACTCPSGDAGPDPGEEEIRQTYEREIAEQMQQVEYRFSFLRVDSRLTALKAIADLKSGRRFEEVFDKYANSFDARQFPHGDLGPQLENSLPIDDLRRFAKMRVGQFSETPHKGLIGWEVEKLVARRTVPAPTLDEMRPRLVIYLKRAHACGWAP